MYAMPIVSNMCAALNVAMCGRWFMVDSSNPSFNMQVPCDDFTKCVFWCCSEGKYKSFSPSEITSLAKRGFYLASWVITTYKAEICLSGFL